jgi:hypothetical protein
MLKSILFLSLSFVLIFSILGPLFLQLYNLDLDAIVLVDISGEEQQKETGSEIDDVKIFEKIHSGLSVINNQDTNLLSDYYQNISSGDCFEVQLPPPQYSV